MNTVPKNELQELQALIGRLQRGELTRPEFRAQSVHYGVYTQHQADLYFVRVRLPFGMLSPDQLQALAAAVETWGQGECHFTTRQGVELHGLSLNQIMPLLRALAEVDLFSHETGGNSVRSIMVCPHAGIGADEPFDVTSYAALLARCFVRHPDFQNLPRKLKIGFSCCQEDCAHTAVQDLGFQARTNAEGAPGFRVLAGGGTGALPRLGQELIDFLPADQALCFTEAFLRVFNRLGDRQNRRRARVKFLVQSLGLARLRHEVWQEMHLLKREQKTYPKAQTITDLPAGRAPGDAPACESSRETPAEEDDFTRWTATQVQQPLGAKCRTIRVSLAGGHVSGEQLRQLAALAQRQGLALRVTPDQGFLLRWAQPGQLPAVFQALAKANLLKPPGVTRLVACPGSSACSNAFTNARALAEIISTRLGAQDDVKDILGQWRIKISGCTNGCALHAIADVGFEGMAHRAGRDWIPAYRVWLGGRERQEQPRLATGLGAFPARRIPELLADLARCFARTRQPQESLSDLLDRVGLEPFAELVRKYQFAPAGDWRPLAVDWGETESYRPRIAQSAGPC